MADIEDTGENEFVTKRHLREVIALHVANHHTLHDEAVSALQRCLGALETMIRPFLEMPEKMAALRTDIDQIRQLVEKIQKKETP